MNALGELRVTQLGSKAVSQSVWQAGRQAGRQAGIPSSITPALRAKFVLEKSSRTAALEVALHSGRKLTVIRGKRLTTRHTAWPFDVLLTALSCQLANQKDLRHIAAAKKISNFMRSIYTYSGPEADGTDLFKRVPLSVQCHIVGVHHLSLLFQALHRPLSCEQALFYATT